MESGGLRYVRKKDFKLRVGLHPENAELAEEFADAVHTLKPTFLGPKLIIEVYQPIVGGVHHTIMEICQNGLPFCEVYTLIPNRPDLVLREDCGHLAYLYERGRVIDQQTILSKDAIDGENFMVHILYLEFEDCKIQTNELRPLHESTRPALSLVRDCGSAC